MSQITSKLKVWVAAGLLSDEQAARILTFETKSDGKRSWFLYGAISVGVAAIGIGIISIVAANWEQIPSTVKLLAFLTIESLVGVALLKFVNRPGMAREALIGLFALLLFAGIGLTAQIFHLKSDGWGGLLFWCALSLPVVVLGATRPLAYLWVIVLMTAETIWFVTRFDRFQQIQDTTNVSAAVCLSLYVFLSLGIMGPRWRRFPEHLAEACRILAFLIIFVGGTCLANILWYVGTDELVDAGDQYAVAYRLQFAPWLGAVLVWCASLITRPPWSKAFITAFVGTLVGVALLLSLPVLFRLPEHPVIGTVLTIAVWSIAALAAVQSGRKRLFDAVTLLITLRLLVVYFEVFGSMMATGIGLILSGFLVLACAWGWYKFRDRLAGWAGYQS